MAGALASTGHEVDLILGHISTGHTLPTVEGVQTLLLNRQKVRSMFLPLVSYLRQHKPDVVFSAEDHLNAVVLLAIIFSGSKAKVSCSSRVTPFDTYSGKLLTKRWWLKQVSKAVSWRADALTCVSEDMVAQYREVFRSAPHVCVYNIVADTKTQDRMREPVTHGWLTERRGPVLVAAGRLAPWKGFVDLIDAMRFVADQTTARLVILGDGPLRLELQQRIDRHGLGHRVALLGYVENPLKYFARADVFVLSSHVEGLPNVLVEAMLCGCTPVATDCPTGPREVLQDGKYGYLVAPKNPAELAKGILRAIDNPIPREKLLEAVRPFHQEQVLRRHFELLGLTPVPPLKEAL
jgi:glycosyltransferase involved in cell wall biosynthesis